MGKFKFNPAKGVMELDIPGQRIAEESVKSEGVSSMPSDSMQSVGLKPEQTVNVATNEGIVQFREKSDYTIFQFIEPKTQSILGYIGGYALDFSFNLEQIKSTERLEQLLEGIKGVYRKMISDQILRQVEQK